MYVCMYVYTGEYDGALTVYTRIYSETKGKDGIYVLIISMYIIFSLPFRGIVFCVRVSLQVHILFLDRDVS